MTCYKCGSHDGHIAPNYPTLKKSSRQDKEGKKKTQVFYRNKQGKINVLDIPDDFHQFEEKFHNANDQIFEQQLYQLQADSSSEEEDEQDE